MLDGYELVADLASGGMATVYLARKMGVGGFQRLVAIKRLHPHLATEPEFIEMFLDEARLAAMIHHPNVVPILEVGTSPQGYYLVMEYIEGDTLARLLARATTAGEQIPAPLVIRMVLDTLSGLHAAHELVDGNGESLNLVHRDISPQNVLVGIDGAARITDFGVARASTRLSSTRTGQLKGKLAYMAPEQARGVDVDRRADLFAVGVVLWEVLAGKRLFKAEGEAATLNRLLFDPIPRLRDVTPFVTSELEAVTMKALERDPRKRHATAASFADELEQAARSIHAVASAKEVASYVQKVMGQEIAQQRLAVRAWLAPSEPSRNTLDDEERALLGRKSVRPARSTLMGVDASGRRGKTSATLWTGLGIAAGALGVAFLVRRGGFGIHPQDPPAPPRVETVAAAPPAPSTTPPTGGAPSAAPPPARGISIDDLPTPQEVQPQKGRGGRWRRPKPAPPPPATPTQGPVREPVENNDIPKNPYR
jgi:eukaryotic-like serine/threonine-protein kinase